MMKPLLLTFTLFATAIAIQPAKADDVYHGARGTAVRGPNGTYVHGHRGYGYGHGGTVVHSSYNWNNTYWRTNKYGYWNGQRGYWRVVNGNHIFVVVR
jgi:hypothetical protein